VTTLQIIALGIEAAAVTGFVVAWVLRERLVKKHRKEADR
jgi:hypothetical protein